MRPDRRTNFLLCLAWSLLAGLAAEAQIETGLSNPYYSSGTRISPATLVPSLRKWYLPQRLYEIYQWKPEEYSNYAREVYERYTPIALEGLRYYDQYGNLITKGWQIYGWSEEYPQDLGSGIYKDPKFIGFFNRLVVTSSHSGQLHTSLTVGEKIRTTLTPLTFAKPRFDGLQWDLVTDKYAATLIASRINHPGVQAYTEGAAPTTFTTFTDLLGFRGLVQIGDFAKTGVTFVNTSHRNSKLSFGDNSLKGLLGGGLNTGYLRTLTVRLTDDSPEDGQAGARLLRQALFVNGVEHPEIEPLIEGGIRRRGVVEANGSDVVTLTYDIQNGFRPGPDDQIEDFREIRHLEVGLVLSNDYKVDATSNLQTDALGQQIFLPVMRASGNVRDGSNQTYHQFRYGLPTGNQLLGLTLDIDNLAGFNLRSEVVHNNRYRRFPNQSIDKNQALATENADAFYATASQIAYPWLAFGEAFSLDANYSTTMFIPNQQGEVDYASEVSNLYEFVDDNDDQDEFPDWTRRYFGDTGSQGRNLSTLTDNWVFPGLDENNDDISDFNQNRNNMPDYTEPFLRYEVDPPAFLFGMDMNNNSVIDRFEDDNEPDYPYRRGHRGYNGYLGVEFFPQTRLLVGASRERLLKTARQSRSTYALFTLKKEYPTRNLSIWAVLSPRKVRDDIPDNVNIWVEATGTTGSSQPLIDELIAQDTFINTTYLEFKYDRYLPLVTKVKYDAYYQLGSQGKGKRDQRSFGLINKADYTLKAQGWTFWPRWKQLFSRTVPTRPEALEIRELSEIFSFVVTRPLNGNLNFIAGTEYEIFSNLIKRPDPVPAEYTDDSTTLILASQLTNTSAYQGYRLTTNIGLNWQRQDFETGVNTNLMAFVNVFAGLGD
ncbi:MAG: hypothetical protein IT369_05810 [Candidatus Latescibacteria bacterium]|nr:hypothetical protein [Candidatus Latescibacterota bacterium]